MKVSCQLHVPATLPPGKEPSEPIWTTWVLAVVIYQISYYEGCGLLGCKAMEFRRHSDVSEEHTLSSSGVKSKVTKKPAEAVKLI
jgi:hypothetical protein